MGVALPQDTSWNAFNNTYNRTAYERICKEFNVDVNADWRQKQSYNNGLGTIYNYWTNLGYHPLNKVDTKYDSKTMSFTVYESDQTFHIDYIAQGSEATYSTFILDNSDGFTRAGVERINDSIRTYCWAILGSQSQTKTDILGTGTAFDAQKQFLVNVEDVINSPVDLPSQIQRYQDTLKYARSKVDYVFGNDLYMSPSNMEMQIGTIQGYNNEIKIATNDQKLGLNIDINSKPVPPKQINKIEGKTTKTNNKPVKSARSAEPIKPTEPKPIEKNESKNISIQHEDNKTALIVGSIVVSLGALLIYEYS